MSLHDIMLSPTTLGAKLASALVATLLALVLGRGAQRACGALFRASRAFYTIESLLAMGLSAAAMALQGRHPLLGTVAIRGAVLAHSAMYLLFVLSLLPGGGGGKGPRRAGDQPRMPSVFGLLRTAQRVKGSLPLG